MCNERKKPMLRNCTIIGEILFKLRKEKNMTQVRVAYDLYISPPQLAFYEKGQREPNLSMLIKLANYYQVTTDFLLGFSSSKKYSSGIWVDIYMRNKDKSVKLICSGNFEKEKIDEIASNYKEEVFVYYYKEKEFKELKGVTK